MKKAAAAVLSVLLVAALFASCGARSASSGSTSAAHAPAPAVSAAQGGVNDGAEKSGAAPDAGTADSPSSAALPSAAGLSSLSADKIVYSYTANIETTTFDDTLKKITELSGKYGAFVENSYVSGHNYGSTVFRTADYTVRVPVKNYSAMTGSLSSLGNVYNESANAQNITAQFTDTSSRLDAYKTEETRLLAMLEKASTVADMITIESKLSDVRYQIESLTSTLKNWQNQVDYSTVTLHITEVSELSSRNAVQRGYWQRLADGLESTLKGIGSFFKGFFMVLVVSLPVLVILAAVAVLVWILYRFVRKKRGKKGSSKPE